jgi:hypothetical protein
VSPSDTVSLTSSVSPSNTPSYTVSPTYTVSVTFSVSPSNTQTPTVTRTATPSVTATPTATASPTMLPLALINCASDSIGSWPSQGSLAIGPSSALVPLCDGWVVVSDTSLHQVKVLNVLQGSVAGTYALPSTPGAMAYDAANGLLYVGLAGSNSLAKVNLNNGAQSSVGLAGPVNSLAMGNSGMVFANVTNNSSFVTSIQVIDGVAGSVVNTVPAPNYYETGIAYDQAHDQLFVQDIDSAPGDLVQMAFNPAGNSLSTLATVGHFQSGYQVAVSPDGQHIAVNVEWTTGLVYSGLTDMGTSTAFGSVNGKWDNNFTSAFSPDSAYLASTDRTQLDVYSVDRHLKQAQWSVAVGAETLAQLAFSRGGGLVYGLLQNATYNPTAGRIFWAQWHPSPSPTPQPSPVSAGLLSCGADSTSGMPVSGTLNYGPSADLLPLCSGLVFTEDQSLNTVTLQNVATGAVLSTYALPAMPVHMALDAANGYLYVACDSDSNLVQINLPAGTLNTVALSAAPYSVVVAGNGDVIANLNVLNWPSQDAVVDRSVGYQALTRTTDAYGPGILSFDPARNFLFDGGGDVSGLERDSFDPVALTITLAQSSSFSTCNTEAPALSPDGAHIAMDDCSSGVTDYDADDFSVSYGLWSTATFPRAAAFSPVGGLFGATDNTTLKVYSAATHGVLQSYLLPAVGTGRSVKFSAGGGIVYCLSAVNGNSQLYWALYP